MQDKIYDVITILGNRPQFIKMAPVSKAIRQLGMSEYIIHTGQHYDKQLSDVFFEEMEIPQPNYILNTTAKTHGAMTASIMIALEEILSTIKGRSILIYGDTNSTLAAALVAVKLQIPIAHVESGPRIYDLNTPEEINRLVADHASRLLFAPNVDSIKNLTKENLADRAYLTGDVMLDAYLAFSEKAARSETIVDKLELKKKNYILMTLHRPNNTDTQECILAILNVLRKIDKTIVFPLHPRTENAFKKYGVLNELHALKQVIVIPAQSYLHTLALLNNSELVITDSGGLQKEAYFAGKPALILFYQTPWPQILECGWQRLYNTITEVDLEMLIHDVATYRPTGERPNIFGNGEASINIAKLLQSHFIKRPF